MTGSYRLYIEKESSLFTSCLLVCFLGFLGFFGGWETRGWVISVLGHGIRALKVPLRGKNRVFNFDRSKLQLRDE